MNSANGTQAVTELWLAGSVISMGRLSVGKIIGSIAAVAVVAVVRRRYFSPISHVPGPWLASVSRLWYIGQIWEGKQNYKLLELHEKYGDFVRVSHDEVSVCHPEAVRALYLSSIRKGDWYNIFVFPDWRYPASISILDPKQKVEFMKYMSNAGFLMHNVLRYEPMFDEMIAKLCEWMDCAAAQQKPMDLDKFFTYIAYDIVGELTFSKPFGFMDKGEDVGNAIAANGGLQIFLCIFGYYRWASYLFNNPLVTWTGLMPVGHIVNTAAATIAERQKNPDANFDMCHHWIKGLEKARAEGYEGFNERHLLSAAVSNLGAGSDTISCVMQSFCYHATKNPAVWRKVREEIDAARKEGRCETPVVSWEDAQQLPYLDATFHEAMRILAPVSKGLPRYTPKGGVTINGAYFPEGVQMSINPGVLHLSKDIWGPDASEFKPERWFAPEIAEQRKCFMPWGLGWGSCPAQQLSKVQMYKTISTIVRDYDLQLVNPNKEWSWAAYFTLNPKEWPVYITRRQG